MLALDPHRLRSYAKRDMIQRRPSAAQPASKQAQTFFLLDAKTCQPLCGVHASSARHLSGATQELLQMAQQILPRPQDQRPLVVADVEHFIVDLFDPVRAQTPFDLLAPLRQTTALQKHCRALPAEQFTPHWAGFAIARETFQPRRTTTTEPCDRYIQRTGAPFDQWAAAHFARDLFAGLEGDLRVHRDTVRVTYDNAPNAQEWKKHFENLPQQLQSEGVDPRLPWLYNFKLDFRFK